MHETSTRLEQQEPATGAKQQIHNIQACFAILEAIQILIKDCYELPQRPLCEALWAKLEWAKVKSRVEELLKQVEVHKSTMQLASQVTNMKFMLKALEGESDVERILRDLVDTSRVSKGENEKITEHSERIKWLAWLSASNPKDFHDTVIRAWQPGTGA